MIVSPVKEQPLAWLILGTHTADQLPGTKERARNRFPLHYGTRYRGVSVELGRHKGASCHDRDRISDTRRRPDCADHAMAPQANEDSPR